jgi:hypothetical protein
MIKKGFYFKQYEAPNQSPFDKLFNFQRINHAHLRRFWWRRDWLRIRQKNINSPMNTILSMILSKKKKKDTSRWTKRGWIFRYWNNSKKKTGNIFWKFETLRSGNHKKNILVVAMSIPENLGSSIWRRSRTNQPARNAHKSTMEWRTSCSLRMIWLSRIPIQISDEYGTDDWH